MVSIKFFIRVKFLFIFLFLLSPFDSYAFWKNYTYGDSVNGLAEEGNYIWSASTGGAIRWDKIDGSYTVLGMVDGIISNYIRGMAISSTGKKWFATDRGVTLYDNTSEKLYIKSFTSKDGLSYDDVWFVYVDSSDNKWFGYGWNYGGVSKLYGDTITTFTTGNSGLAQDAVMAMAEEGSGVYWFGTGSEGLSRYDGYKWVTFNIYNTGIINDDVNSIHKDASGNMWFGTNGGVSKYGDGSWTGYDNYNTNGSLPNEINVVKSDTNGNMWFGSNSSGAVFYDGWTWMNYNTSNSGIADNRIYAEGVSSVGIWFGFGDSCYPTGCGTSYFDGVTWTTFNTSNSGLPSNYVYSIRGDSGTVWFGSDFGLTRFSDGNWTNYPMPSRVNSIDIDSSGNLWLGTESNGVCRFDAGTGICTWFNTSNSGIASNRVVYVFVDSYGRKWFGHGPDPVGVSMFDDISWVVYNTSNSGIRSNNVWTISQDASNNMWFGFKNQGKGVSKFTGSVWENYDTRRKLANNSIRSIGIDSTNTKWFGLSDGVCYFNGITWQTYDSSNSPLSGSVVALAFENNIKWFGTYGYGIYRFDGNTWINYNSSNSPLPSNNVTSIIVDSSGKKWFGTDKGIAEFDGITWTLYKTSANGLPSNYVRDIAVSSSGVIKWFATDNGAAKFDDNIWTTYNTQNSGIAWNNLNAVEIDTIGNLWLGTEGSGVSMFNGITWTTYNKLNTNGGLPSNFVREVTISPGGDKWFGTSGGASRFNGITWTAYTTQNSGLPNNDVRGIDFEPPNIVWFGTSGGGAAYYDGITWTVFNKSNSGIGNNYVRDVAVDHNGIKWFATGGPISAYNGNEWKNDWAVRANVPIPLSGWMTVRIDPGNIKFFGGLNGGCPFALKDMETWDENDDRYDRFLPYNSRIPSCTVYAIAFEQNGKIWFGTDSGVGLFVPNFSSIQVSELPYAVQISWVANPLGINPYISPETITSVKIYRSLSLNGDYYPLTWTNALTGTYIDEDFMMGMTRYYWLSLVTSSGKELKEIKERVWGRPTSSLKPDFVMSPIDPARTGAVGDTIDYPVSIVSLDGMTAPVSLFIPSDFTIPEGITYSFYPVIVTPPGVSVLKLTINSYPTTCPSGRCVIPFKGLANDPSRGEIIQTRKVLLNVIDPSSGSQSFISHYFHPDPVNEEISNGDYVEIRGRVYPPCPTAYVSTTFTPPDNKGNPEVVTAPIGDDGWWSLKFKIKFAGFWEVLSSWNGGCGYNGSDTSGQPELSPSGVPAEKADTIINISTTADENTSIGDPVTATIRIGPNPGVVSVEIKVTNPDESILADVQQDTNADGEATYTFTVQDSGYTKVSAEWDGNDDYNGSSAEAIVPVNSPVGMGIIVGGRSTATVTQTIINNLVRKAYKTLKSRNISDDRIYLLHKDPNFDADEDGDADTDASNSDSNLQSAIETWAKDLVYIGTPPECDTYAPYQTPLNIYLIGYGTTDQFYIDETTNRTTASELATYISHLVDGIQGRYTSEGCSEPAPSTYPVNIILDFKYSGSFIDNVGPYDERIVLTGTSSSQTPHFDSDGSVSYSYKFFDEIDKGDYIGTAHSDAKYYIQNLFSDQTPQLDADGDGTPNEVNDELQASEERMEFRPSGDMQPTIEGVKGSQTITQTSSPPETSAELWAVVEDREDPPSSLTVKAVIYPPDDAANEFPHTITLTPSSPTFKGTYDGFYGYGVYKIVYIAEDSAGNQANVKTGSVSVSDSVAPENVASVSVSYQGNGDFYVSWPPSTSKDTQGYILYVTKDDEYYDQVDVGNVVNYTYHVNGPGTYIFTVKSYDRVPNTASGTSSQPQYTPSDLVYFHASREGSNLYLFWEVSDKRGVIGYDILGGDRPDDIRRLNTAMIPFTGGVERVELNGISEDIKFIYVYIYYEDGSVVVAGAFDIFDSVIEVWDRGEDVEREKAKGRYIIVANYKFWDVLDGYVSYRRQQGFDVEVVSQSYSFGGDYDYLFLISEEWTSEPYIMNEGKNIGILLVKSDDELRDYLNRVMEYEGERSRWLRSYYRDGVIYYEYNGRYRLGVAKEGDFKWDVLRGDDKFIGYVLTDSDDELEDVDLLIMKGDVNLGELGKLTVGDPALFIGSSEVSADTSFGCEQMSKKRTSLIYLFILISLISLPLFLMKLKKAEKE